MTTLKARGESRFLGLEKKRPALGMTALKREARKNPHPCKKRKDAAPERKAKADSSGWRKRGQPSE
jgi:hypothetical protein